MLFALVILSIIIISALDNSNASVILGTGMYIIGATFVLSNNRRKSYKQNFRLYNIVFIIYFSLAYLVSLSFSSTDFYEVSDPSNYIDSYLNRTYFFFGKDDLKACYLGLADNNFLYNAYLNIMAMLTNDHLGGMTVFGMTLCQTLWGILSALILYRILYRHIDCNKAFNYTIIFAICSQFLFYSCIIVRDILLCFLYLCAFDIVDRKFSITGLINLVIIVFLAWGIRLYSGIFATSFIAYYIYIRCRMSHLKYLATLLFVIVLAYATVSLLASSLMDQTITELNDYKELTTERSAGGIVSKLQSLPPVINNLAIVFFTMIRPMPPFGVYENADTFSNIAISTMWLIAGFFWFVVFYSLCYLMFIKKFAFKVSFDNNMLLTICIIFLLANAAHPDIRRMLPVFPILFVLYAKLCNYQHVGLFGSYISKNLIFIYAIMAFGLLVIT